MMKRLVQFVILPLFIAINASIAINTASASGPDRAAELQSLFNHSGVGAHLNLVHETVTTEAAVTRQQCDENGSSANMDRLIEDLLSSDILHKQFLTELDQRINESQLATITQFTQSDLGQRIYQAEAASVELDDKKFASLLAELKASGSFNEERVMAIRQMIKDTGAVYFLTALNTELSATVAMASICTNTRNSIEQAELEIRKERGSEALYRSFLRGELIHPAMVVYRDLSNSDIQTLSDFAKSDAGNAYYAALIQGIRSVMSDRIEQLSIKLKTLQHID